MKKNTKFITTKQSTIASANIVSTANPEGFSDTWLAALRIGDVVFYSDRSYSTYDSARRKSRKIVALLNDKKSKGKTKTGGGGKKC